MRTRVYRKGVMNHSDLDVKSYSIHENVIELLTETTIHIIPIDDLYSIRITKDK